MLLIYDAPRLGASQRYTHMSNTSSIGNGEAMTIISDYDLFVSGLLSKPHSQFMEGSDEAAKQGLCVTWVSDEDLKLDDIARRYRETAGRLQKLGVDTGSSPYTQFLRITAEAFRRCATAGNYEDALRKALDCCNRMVPLDTQLKRSLTLQLASMRQAKKQTGDLVNRAVRRAYRRVVKPWWRFW